MGHELALDLPEPNTLSLLYQGEQFVHLPGLISPAGAAELFAATADVDVQEVICGNENVRFGEQSFGDDHPVARFFARDELRRLALALTGNRGIPYIQCWASVYRLGEFINPHTDVEGSIQVLVCLHAPPADSNGGQLLLHPGTPRQVTLALSAGDAVVFKATEVRHCTTPLTGSAADPNPLRVVVVGRYFGSVLDAAG